VKRGVPVSHEPDLSDSRARDFDYSTPEAQAALRGITELALEIRDEVEVPLRLSERKVRLYERTLGLAVIPVLIRRAAIRLLVRIKRHRGGKW
jgi:hypothetical protein